MADIQTDTGKQWLSEFQGSKNKMRERILAIEAEIRQAVKDEISFPLVAVVEMQGYVKTYSSLTSLNAEQTAALQTDLQTLDTDITVLANAIAKLGEKE